MTTTAPKTSNIHLRGVDRLVLLRLKQEAKAQNVSLNQLILLVLRCKVGLSNQRPKTLHHDLDKLAGTWSKEEEQQFLQSIGDFSKIDKEMWQ